MKSERQYILALSTVAMIAIVCIVGLVFFYSSHSSLSFESGETMVGQSIRSAVPIQSVPPPTEIVLFESTLEVDAQFIEWIEDVSSRDFFIPSYDLEMMKQLAIEYRNTPELSWTYALFVELGIITAADFDSPPSQGPIGWSPGVRQPGPFDPIIEDPTNGVGVQGGDSGSDGPPQGAPTIPSGEYSPSNVLEGLSGSLGWAPGLRDWALQLSEAEILSALSFGASGNPLSGSFIGSVEYSLGDMSVGFFAGQGGSLGVRFTFEF